MRSELILSACLLLGGGTAAFAEDTLIVHGGSAVATLSADQAKDLFLGKKTTWEDGSKVIVVVVKSGASNDGLMGLVGKNAQQFTTGWKKLVFTGKGSMPEEAADDAAAVAMVAKTPGAIALVDKAKVGDGVKAFAAQ